PDDRIAFYLGEKREPRLSFDSGALPAAGGGGGIGGRGAGQESPASAPVAGVIVMPDQGVATGATNRSAQSEIAAFRSRYGLAGGGGGGPVPQHKQGADVIEGDCQGRPIDPATGQPATWQSVQEV